MKTVAITGHRPNKLLAKGEKWGLSHSTVKQYGSEIRKELLRQAGFNLVTKSWDEQIPITFITGMALGVDTIGALVVLKLKEEFPALFHLECALPCLEQDKKWTKEDKERYASLLKRADVLTYVSKTAYTNGCMQDRNEYMVDQADVVLAIWDGTKSGTGNCVVYAMAQAKHIELIEPVTLARGVL